MSDDKFLQYRVNTRKYTTDLQLTKKYVSFDTAPLQKDWTRQLGKYGPTREAIA